MKTVTIVSLFVILFLFIVFYLFIPYVVAGGLRRTCETTLLQCLKSSKVQTAASFVVEFISKPLRFEFCSSRSFSDE